MNDSEVKAPVALVSGASGGIGTAICRQLVGAGYRVVATARRLDSLQELQQELGDALYPLVLDLTDAQAVRQVTSAIPADFSDIGVVVNNAGHDVGGRRKF